MEGGEEPKIILILDEINKFEELFESMNKNQSGTFSATFNLEMKVGDEVTTKKTFRSETLVRP